MEQYTAKFNQLSMGEKAIVIGGLVMLIAGLFFPWWSFSEGGFSASQTGLEAPGSIWSLLAILLSIVMAGVVLAERFGNMKLPDLGSITWAQAWLGASIALIVLMLLKAWRINSTDVGGIDVGGFGWGYFIAALAAAAIVYGGFMKYQEAGGSTRTTTM